MPEWLWSVVQVLAGWFIADLGTGCVHLFLDNAHFARDWPFLGPLVRDFALHHVQPRWFLRWSFFYSNRETLLIGALLIALGLVVAPWFWIPCGVGVAISQEAHRWAHRENRPWIIRALQRWRIILSPASHERHHGNFGRSFGILNGWSHRPMDLLLWAWRRAMVYPLAFVLLQLTFFVGLALVTLLDAVLPRQHLRKDSRWLLRKWF